MRETDLGRLLEIEELCFPTPWTENMFRSQMRLADISINLVVVDGGMVIGYLAGWIGYYELHILSIAVIPRRQGRGAADELLTAVIEQCDRIGIKKIVLEVRAGNIRAQRFYQRNGFRHIGRREKYYRENGEDALVLELDLE